MLYISILLSLISIYLIRKKINSKFLAILIIAFFFLIFFSSGIWWISNYFTGEGISEAIIYYLNNNLEGSGYGDFIIYILFFTSYVIFISLISFFCFNLITIKKNLLLNKKRVISALLILFLSFVINPISSDIYFILKKNISSGDSEIPYNFHQISLDSISQIKDKKNIIYIYLESLEATYMNQEVFPDLTPNISKYYNNSLAFKDIQQTYGDGWTIGGMVSSQCGVPLIGDASNSMSDIDLFLPGVICLGDILAANNYLLEYFGGANINFGGKGKFLKQHGFHNVYGKNDLIEEISNKDYLSNWGLYDDTLYDTLYDRFKELYKSDKPFGLFALTLDTHHPKGNVSKSCRDIKYLDGKNSILNSVHCADKLLFNFITDIKKIDKNDDTLIVVSSDHLAFGNTAKDLLEKIERRNLFFVLNSGLNNQIINKSGSLIDIAPTVLNLMSFPVNNLAFGKNLLMADELTMVENFPNTREHIRNNLDTNQNLVSKIWNFPTLKKDLIFYEGTSQLKLDDRVINYPALLIFDEKNSISRVIFEASAPRRIPNYFSKLNTHQKFVWVDSCSRIRVFEPNILGSKGDCLAYGKFGEKNIEAKKISDGFKLNYSDLKIKFETTINEFGSKNIENFKKEIKFISKYGSYAHNFFNKDDSLEGQYFIQVSNKLKNSSSFILNLENQKKFIINRRGLNLFGISKTGLPVLIKNIDICNDIDRIKYPDQKQDDNYSFQNDILKYEDYFGSFLIISHDIGNCRGQKKLKKLFLDTKLENFKKNIKADKYIAIISAENTVDEFISNDNNDLSIYALNFTKKNHIQDNQKLKKNLPRVAHAGGGYKNKTYSNSIDALNENSKFYELFELDFSWTTDDHLVCIHDWIGRFKSVFSINYEGPVSLSKFNNLNAQIADGQKCTIYKLIDWLQDNPQGRIVTDIKKRNIEALEFIANYYPHLKNRFVPQVYKPIEYFHAKYLGYNDVIWTLYKFRKSDEEILEYLKIMDLYGLTMPKNMAYRGLASIAQKETGVLSWSHTINSNDEYKKLIEVGVNQIYTSFLK